jgi:NAD(P)-dependent dehydrogenase (short-subunit alcohol dehydrogenase family)
MSEMEQITISSERVRECVTLLEQIVGNRRLLSQVGPDDRKALLMAAGRFSRPDRLELIKMAKAHRRQEKKKVRMQDRATRSKAGIRKAREQSVFIPPPREALLHAPSEGRTLNHPRQCYVCKDRYTELHPFYDSLCVRCGNFNYEKRFQTASLLGKVALITGARLKIGYQSALMLLRAGATVVVTTRFPRDAAVRFAKESDYEQWSERIHVFGLDLRHSPSVELFCRSFEQRYPRLDYLINNAAQTVRRPPGFYSHLMELEKAPFESLPACAQRILEPFDTFCKVLTAREEKRAGAGNWLEILKDTAPGIGIRESASLSMIPYRFDDTSQDADLFPQGKRDADLQQVDLRRENTWRLRLGEINTPEMLEVQLINSVAPFILCGKLRDLMTRDITGEKHIINVSAMEGKFNRHTKTEKHPHTNMAKAALNMLTLTSAPDLVKEGIFMNAVDTGWVTDEDPAHHTESKQIEHDFHPPLDIVDGAARVLDPIFNQKLTGHTFVGKFLKDYFPTAW